MEPMWLWAILGLALLAAEMATGTIYILWFGISALCVAIAIWLFPNTPNAIQFLMFAFLSLGSLLIWKHNYKKNEKNHRIGQSQGQEVGRIGQGLMGSKTWTAVSNESIAVGERVKVTAVEGNALRVTADIDS